MLTNDLNEFREPGFMALVFFLHLCLYCSARLKAKEELEDMDE
jgi:hypothetical protein